MPPPKKRSYASTSLDNGWSASAPSKRRRPPEVIVLSSSDSEPDAFDANDTCNAIASEDDDNCPLASQESQPRRSWGLLEQLQQDAFDDFKADLCFELDGLRESAREDAEQGLHDVLRQWIGQDKASRHADHFYYRLDHTYNEGQLAPGEFRGRDALVLETVDQLASELGFEIFLALLERDDSRPTPDYLARSLVDLQGHELISYIPVDDNNLLQTRSPSLKNPAPDSCATAVMIIPRDSLVDYVMQYVDVPPALALCAPRDESLDRLVKHFIAGISQPHSRERLLPVLKELCVRVWQLDEPRGLGVLQELTVQNLLKALAKAEEWSFLEQAASHVGERTPVGFFTWVTDQVATGSLPFPKLENSLLMAASTSTTFFDKLHIAWQLVSAKVPQKECEQLARQLITDLPEEIDSCGPCSALGFLLVDLVYLTQDEPGFLESKLVRVVERNSTQTSFVLGVLDGLRFETRAGRNILSVPKGLFERLAQLFIHSLDVSKLFQRGQHLFQDGTCTCPGRFSRKPESAGAVDALQLASTISQLLANGTDSIVASLACKIVADVTLIPRQEFVSLWLPFLGHLIKVLEERNVPLSTPRYRHLFAAILETYLDRCVGSLPFLWTPRFKQVQCFCALCRLFNRFLASSVSAASFSSLSFSDVGHINAFLIPCAFQDYRCQFKMEDGVLIVRKLQQVDPGVQAIWADNMERASQNIGKLDGPALIAILGRDYARIRNFQSHQKNPQQSPPVPPVPIESLGDPGEPRNQLTTPQTHASANSVAPFISAHQSLIQNPRLNPPVHSPSADSQLISYASLNRGTAPRTTTSSNAGASNNSPDIHQGRNPLLTPGPSPRIDLFHVSPYSVFADELGARLSKLGSFGTPDSIQKAILRRWGAMSTKDREPYVTKAEGLRSSLTSTAVSSVPLDLRKDRLPSTPKPSTPKLSPHGATYPSLLTPFQGSPNAMSAHSGFRCGRESSRQPVSSSTSLAAQPSSPSSRVFGAPISSSRLNSIPVPGAQSEVKTEFVPQATSLRAKRKVAEVVDLTGDD